MSRIEAVAILAATIAVAAVLAALSGLAAWDAWEYAESALGRRGWTWPQMVRGVFFTSCFSVALAAGSVAVLASGIRSARRKIGGPE